MNKSEVRYHDKNHDLINSYRKSIHKIIKVSIFLLRFLVFDIRKTISHLMLIVLLTSYICASFNLFRTKSTRRSSTSFLTRFYYQKFHKTLLWITARFWTLQSPRLALKIKIHWKKISYVYFQSIMTLTTKSYQAI